MCLHSCLCVRLIDSFPSEAGGEHTEQNQERKEKKTERVTNNKFGRNDNGKKGEEMNTAFGSFRHSVFPFARAGGAEGGRRGGGID